MFQTQYTNRHTEKGETFRLPSRTVPDGSLSVTEIMQRFANGLPVEGQKVALYEEEEMPNVATMDLSEKMDLLRANQRVITMLKDTEQRAIAKKAHEKLRKSIEDEINASKKQENQNPPKADSTNIP